MRIFYFVFIGMLICMKSFSADTTAPAALPPCCCSVREGVDDAWWTGPLLTPSAATLPRGHFLFEPYLFDIKSPHLNGLGSLTYLLYGLTYKFTIGYIPTAGYNKVDNGLSSSGIKPGDANLVAQYRLTQFKEGSCMPTISFVLQESLPIGKFDKLGSRPADGFGSGAYTTTLAVYSQTSFWLPNGRILRMRFDALQAFPGIVNVQDVSVYGTTAGFSGHAAPGNSLTLDASWEYSLTQRFVLALDVTHRYQGNTHVSGYNVLDPNGFLNTAGVQLNSSYSEAFGFAPAIEYSWTPNMGVLFGARFITAGHNTTATITPAVGINFVY
jgi:hypothetical protein